MPKQAFGPMELVLNEFQETIGKNINLLIKQGALRLYAKDDSLYTDPECKCFLIVDSPTAQAIRAMEALSGYYNDPGLEARQIILHEEFDMEKKKTRRTMTEETKEKISQARREAWARKLNKDSEKW